MPAANTITIAPGPKLKPGAVAIWERDPGHPNGEIYLAAPHEGEEPGSIEAARTPEVNRRLADGRLIDLSDDDEAPRARRGRRSAAPVDEPPADGGGE